MSSLAQILYKFTPFAGPVLLMEPGLAGTLKAAFPRDEIKGSLDKMKLCILVSAIINYCFFVIHYS